MRVAILEASHWHVPLYLQALEAPGLEVVAVSDLEQNCGKAIADRFGGHLYTRYEELLERESIDFAFAERFRPVFSGGVTRQARLG